MTTSTMQFLFLFSICFFPLSDNAIAEDVHGTRKQSITQEEIETEFLQWIDRIAANTHPISIQPLAVQKNFIPHAPARVISVGKKGKRDFKTVQAAVNSIKIRNKESVVIRIDAGVYQEKVKIPQKKPFITFQGAGSELTTITWHDTTASAGTTFKTATVSVMSDHFIARDITFKNSAPAPLPGAVRRQAVALQISGDESAFYNCQFLGVQDTLYDHKGRHYFYNCFIQGSIDFIFGDGRSLYKGCTLNTIATYGSLTAQKRKSPKDDTGFSFVDCKVRGSGILYLGRAWGPFSRVVYISSELDIEVAPGGWYNWGDTRRDRTVFYGQYNCSGPGASLRGKVSWSHELTAAQAAPFMSVDFVGGESWIQV